MKTNDPCATEIIIDVLHACIRHCGGYVDRLSEEDRAKCTRASMAIHKYIESLDCDVGMGVIAIMVATWLLQMVEKTRETKTGKRPALN